MLLEFDENEIKRLLWAVERASEETDSKEYIKECWKLLGKIKNQIEKVAKSCQS